MSQIWKTQQWSQDWKRSVLIPISKKGSAKEYSDYQTIMLISSTNKVKLKILQDRLQQYVNWELPDVHAGFRKGRETNEQIANIHWIIEKAREFQKNIYFCFIVLAWKIPGTEESSGLPCMGSQSQTRLKWLSSSSNAQCTSLWLCGSQQTAENS